jgi:hypothetical protein
MRYLNCVHDILHRILHQDSDLRVLTVQVQKHNETGVVFAV